MKLFAIDAIGNLAVFTLFWYWLGIPVADTGQLIWIGLLALCIAVGVAVLIGLAFTRDLAQAVRRIPAYLAWILILAALLLPLRWASQFTADASLVLGSWLTYQMRVAVEPEAVTKWLNWTLLLIGTLITFLLALPAAARIAEQGLAALRNWRPLLKLSYLVECVIYAILGIVIPLALFQWIPELKGLPAQSASFILRLLIAFVLYVTCWLEFARRCRRQALAPKS